MCISQGCAYPGQIEYTLLMALRKSRNLTLLLRYCLQIAVVVYMIYTLSSTLSRRLRLRCKEFNAHGMWLLQYCLEIGFIHLFMRKVPSLRVKFQSLLYPLPRTVHVSAQKGVELCMCCRALDQLLWLSSPGASAHDL